MKKWPFLLLICAAAAQAASSARGDRVERAAALESATISAGPDASPIPAPVAATPAAPDQPRAAARGNPLWAIPLRSLAATRDRPLFSASRRPPAPVVADAPAPAAAAPMPVANRPADPERPPMALIGTVVSADERIAIVINEATRTVSRLREGDEDSGWRMRAVLARSAIVEKGDQSVTLGFPKPGDQPPPIAAAPPGAPPPAVNDSAL